MAGVTVEFGAKDTGLQKTLQTVQNELTALKKDLSDGSLSFDELNQAMRKVAQAERLESQLQRIANETEQAGNEAVGAANDFDKLDREMDQVAANSGTTSVSMGQLRSAFTKITGIIAGVTAALQGMRAAFNYMQEGVVLAMSLEETMNRVGEIFGSSAMQIQQWAQGSVQGLAMTKAEAMDAASQFAIFGQSAGLAGDDLVGFSTRLTRLATDIASFNNAEPEEGVRAIGAALRGESEPIRRFGVLLDEATLKNRALQMGLIDTTTEALTPQQRVLAAYNEILEQTVTQQGDFERTSGSASNQTKILKASLEELQTEVGQRVVPAWEKFVNYLNDDFIPTAGGVMMTLDQLGNAIDRGVDRLGELDRKIKGVGERNDALGATYRAVNKSLMGFNQLMHDTFTQLTPVGYVLQTVSNNTEEYKNQTDSASGAAAEAAKKIEELGNNIDGLNGGLGAASSRTMTLTNNMSGLGEASTFNTLNEGATEFAELLGDSNVKLNDMNITLGTMEPTVSNQASLFGDINTELTISQDQLSAQLQLMQEQVAQQERSVQAEAERNAKIAERQALLAQQQAQALEEYNLQIQINEAIAAGNTEEARTLERKNEIAKLAEKIKNETGLSADEAFEMARNLLISKNSADIATEASKKLAKELGGASGRAADISASLIGAAGNAGGLTGALGGTSGAMETVAEAAQRVGEAKMNKGAEELNQEIKGVQQQYHNLMAAFGIPVHPNVDVTQITSDLGLVTEGLDDVTIKAEQVQRSMDALSQTPVADLTPILESGSVSTKIRRIGDYLRENFVGLDVTPYIDRQAVGEGVEATKNTIESALSEFKVVVRLDPQIEGDIESIKSTLNTEFAEPTPLTLEGDESISQVRNSAESNFADSIPLNLDGESAIESIRQSAESDFEQPITTNLDGTESVKEIREALAEPVTVKLTPEVDGGAGGAGMTLNDVVAELREIKEKLPLQALA